jgi:Spy/CpxP family protein refolding chaperone
MLDRVKATPEQRTQIKQITDAAAADIKKQREANAGMHQQAMKVFTAPTVDANAVEQLRQQRMAQHDQASRRMSQAMLDISRVLTPDQRAQIAAQMAKRGERRGEGGHKH